MDNIHESTYISDEDFETARRNSINKQTVISRVNELQWDVERAITEPAKVYKPFKHIWEEWEPVASQYGVNRDLFYYRVRTKGLPESEAAKTPPGKGGNKQTRWTEEELDEMAKKGLTPKIVTARIDLLNWSKHDALNTPKLTESERIKRVITGTKKYHMKKSYENNTDKKTLISHMSSEVISENLTQVN